MKNFEKKLKYVMRKLSKGLYFGMLAFVIFFSSNNSITMASDRGNNSTKNILNSSQPTISERRIERNKNVVTMSEFNDGDYIYLRLNGKIDYAFKVKNNFIVYGKISEIYANEFFDGKLFFYYDKNTKMIKIIIEKYADYQSIYISDKKDFKNGLLINLKEEISSENVKGDKVEKPENKSEKPENKSEKSENKSEKPENKSEKLENKSEKLENKSKKPENKSENVQIPAPKKHQKQTLSYNQQQKSSNNQNPNTSDIGVMTTAMTAIVAGTALVATKNKKD
ncbi:hypothetical protein EQF93_05945 [Helcococcus ovis]|uniref:hypothetical protein n=1 Tax=Helcococcus ovis TaxID=72026 RepID=UPI0010704641|nr:hypothetical protein [Helcococcus ovis]TFF67089.1 hypothetical protein EQF93_05945 [Helcococcus ovis]WNZ01785.1 hypothetical protein EQF90_002795 [Helcococcus ovis]